MHKSHCCSTLFFQSPSSIDLIFLAQQLFQRVAQTITPEAIESVKAALASSEAEKKTEYKKRAVPRKAAGRSWEDPTLAEWPERFGKNSWNRSKIHNGHRRSVMIVSRFRLKQARPFKQAEFDIIFGHAVSQLAGYRHIDWAMAYKSEKFEAIDYLT